MSEFIIRFLIGGLIVCIFAVIGDVLQPKSFAGIFAAAPSVALGSLGISFVKKGTIYVTDEAQTMWLGAIAFFCYSLLVTWLMLRYRYKSWFATSVSWLLWLAVAFIGLRIFSHLKF